jgi:hypothetical protein
MDRIAEIIRVVKEADARVREDRVNWATSHCLMIEELKEILGMNDFRGFVKEWDAQGNQIMVEVTR